MNTSDDNISLGSMDGVMQQERGQSLKQILAIRVRKINVIET